MNTCSTIKTIQGTAKEENVVNPESRGTSREKKTGKKRNQRQRTPATGVNGGRKVLRDGGGSRTEKSTVGGEKMLTPAGRGQTDGGEI